MRAEAGPGYNHKPELRFGVPPPSPLPPPREGAYNIRHSRRNELAGQESMLNYPSPLPFLLGPPDMMSASEGRGGGRDG